MTQRLLIAACACALCAGAATLVGGDAETGNSSAHEIVDPLMVGHPRQLSWDRTDAQLQRANRSYRGPTTTQLLMKEHLVVPTTEPPSPVTPTDLSGNRALGYDLMRQRWGDDQWHCLDLLWGPLESGWNQYADNPYSSAYGIPQANPGSKMAAFGADWRTNPATQILWGLSYISDRYGTPCPALDYRMGHGSY